MEYINTVFKQAWAGGNDSNYQASHLTATDSASFYVSESGQYVGRTVQCVNESNKISPIEFSGTNQRTDRFFFKDVHVEERTNITFELYYDNPGSDVDIHVDKISFIQGVRKVCHQPFQVQAAQPRSRGIFGSKVLHYGTGSGDLNISRWQREKIRAISQSAQNFYSRSLAEYSYRDDFFHGMTNLAFDGCRITGPRVNAPTNITAINYTPVIEVYTVSPNDITVADPLRPGYNPPGGGQSTPGYLLVR